MYFIKKILSIWKINQILLPFLSGYYTTPIITHYSYVTS